MTILRTVALVAALAMSVAVPLTAEAQATAKIWRIGYLSLVAGEREEYTPWLAGFRDALRQLGYVEGDNVVLEQRYAAGQVDRLPALAAELVRLQVDVLLTSPAGTAAVAKAITQTVPIVFVGEPDPVGTGLVTSLARPGGNATGLADAHGDLLSKRLELLKEAVSSPARFGVLWNPSNATTARQLKTIEAAAPALGLTVVPVGVDGPTRADVDRAFVRLRQERVGALVVLGDATLGAQRRRIAEQAVAHRLPTSGTHRAWAEGGLLMSYGTDFVALFRRAAVLVDRILKGTPPATLPVEQPTKFELTINTKTAEALGLAIPSSLLLRADQLIR